MAARRATGFLQRIAQKKKGIYVRHKLDTEVDQFYKTMHNSVIPEFMDFVKEIPGYPERIKECVSYTTPAFFDGWNFSIELVFKTVADQQLQTEENLEKARMLRALMDISFSMTGIVDDFADKGEYRWGKKIWASICEGGNEAAIYDTYSINYLIFLTIQRHFRNDIGYSRILELFALATGAVAIGNTLDILTRNSTEYNVDMWKYIIDYKAMRIVSAASGVGLVHAGVTSDDLIQKILDVFGHYGLIYQVWDDFMEHYSVEEQSGKKYRDCINNVNSWATVTAMAHFNPAQAKEFKACYGSSDPVKKSKVRTLFDEVDLPGKYMDYLYDNRLLIEKKISNIPDARIRKACTSYLEWLVGEEPHDANDQIRRNLLNDQDSK